MLVTRNGMWGVGLENYQIRGSMKKPGTHTNHSERREEIRKAGIDALVQSYNRLVDSIIAKWAISSDERDILLAMQQEWTSHSWAFYGKIKEDELVYIVPHMEWTSRFDNTRWSTDILKWQTALRMWSTISNTTLSSEQVPQWKWIPLASTGKSSEPLYLNQL